LPKTATKSPVSGYKVAVSGNRISCFQDTIYPVSGYKVSCFGNKCGQAFKDALQLSCSASDLWQFVVFIVLTLDLIILLFFYVRNVAKLRKGIV